MSCCRAGQVSACLGYAGWGVVKNCTWLKLGPLFPFVGHFLRETACSFGPRQTLRLFTEKCTWSCTCAFKSVDIYIFGHVFREFYDRLWFSVGSLWSFRREQRFKVIVWFLFAVTYIWNRFPPSKLFLSTSQTPWTRGWGWGSNDGCLSLLLQWLSVLSCEHRHVAMSVCR